MGIEDIQRHPQHPLDWKVEAQSPMCSLMEKSVELEVSMMPTNNLLIFLASFINLLLQMMLP